MEGADEGADDVGRAVEAQRRRNGDVDGGPDVAADEDQQRDLSQLGDPVRGVGGAALRRESEVRRGDYLRALAAQQP